MRLQRAIKLAKAIASSPKMVDVNHKGKTFQSSSPKATGIAGMFSMGKTRSGKPVGSYSHTSEHKDWGAGDHMDAYRAHAKHVSELTPEDTHPKLIQHHKDAMQTHWKAANPDIDKSIPFEYSLAKAMKNKKMGKTKSGKQIYTAHWATHSKSAIVGIVRPTASVD